MEIYLSVEKNIPLTEIESTRLIEKELEILESKSGITIDEYGKTTLYLDHIKFLNGLINVKNEWKFVFEKAIEMNSSIIIEGE